MIFCYMDGVIVNFDEGIKQLCGAYPWELARPQMWQKVIETPDYWVNLAQLPHAEALISYLRPKGFKILTGLPVYGYEKAAREKLLWIRKHFGDGVEVICCLTKDKSSYCQKGDVLIDDREQTIKEWRAAGGIGIYHTSWENTLVELQKYGY